MNAIELIGKKTTNEMSNTEGSIYIQFLTMGRMVVIWRNQNHINIILKYNPANVK